MQTPADQRAERTEARQIENDLYSRQMQDRTADRMDRQEQRQINETGAGTYEQTFERERAKADIANFSGAMTGMRDAPALEARGNRALSLLDGGAATGPFADMRIMTGRAVGGALGFLPGVPNRQETQNLEQLRLIGSQGALGDVGQLKGPLSEKELAFIQRLQIDPNATEETNRMVAETMTWTARRQAAYGAAMDQWRRELGSPSSANANGLTFDRWWGQYAAQTIPQPGTPEADALASYQAANPGREAAVVQPEAVRGGVAPDPASGQPVAQRGRFNPQTGEIEWQ
jgi:hypothetical protein